MNSVNLIGRLTAAVELKTTPTGKSVAQFALAVPRGKDQPTDFIDCVAWEKTAELLTRYFAKGDQVGIGGKLQTRTWKDAKGANRKTVEVIVTDVTFISSKSKSEGESQSESKFNLKGEGMEPLAPEDELPF